MTAFGYDKIIKSTYNVWLKFIRKSIQLFHSFSKYIKFTTLYPHFLQKVFSHRNENQIT